MQNIPVVSAPVHALFPQMQGATVLGVEPSVVAQVGNWLHLFWDR